MEAALRPMANMITCSPLQPDWLAAGSACVTQQSLTHALCRSRLQRAHAWTTAWSTQNYNTWFYGLIQQGFSHVLLFFCSFVHPHWISALVAKNITIVPENPSYGASYVLALSLQSSLRTILTYSRLSGDSLELLALISSLEHHTGRTNLFGKKSSEFEWIMMNFKVNWGGESGEPATGSPSPSEKGKFFNLWTKFWLRKLSCSWCVVK